MRSVARMRRIVGVVASAVLIALIAVGGSGCSACTLIGYISRVDVILEGPAADEVEHLELCTERGCSALANEATPAPTSGPLYFATDLGDGRWRVDLDLDAPDEATIEVFDAAGNALGRATTELEWRRVGGSEQCGGPVETDPIIMRIG